MEVCQKVFFEEHEEFNNLLEKLIKDSQADEQGLYAYERMNQILEKYQEQSRLLDPYLEQIVNKIFETIRPIVLNRQFELSFHICKLFQLLYILSKVRSAKTIVKFMTHETRDLEPLVAFIQNVKPKMYIWETKYILLIWLSLVCRIPFDLKRLESGITEQIIEICQTCLNAAGKEREAASEVLGRLMARGDMTQIMKEQILPWLLLVEDEKIFLILGKLNTIALLYKYCSRHLLEEISESVLEFIRKLSLHQKYKENALVRKFITKISQRMALQLTQPVLPYWRYQRGGRSLKMNLKTETDQNQTEKQQSVILWDHKLTPKIEEITETLLDGLKDNDTIVRWSASKGIGRLTQRLPKEMAQEIIEFIIDSFHEDCFMNKQEMDYSRVSDTLWHGNCLALAELARRGLLLPDKLQLVIHWIAKCLTFEQRRGSFSVGAHVRDAACYCCWAFARAYSPSIMLPYVEILSTHLVNVSLFDREVNIRRAASAAFQENVGRVGQFPHGIDIVSIADYFAVGNRKQSYLETSFEVSQFSEYRLSMMTYLTQQSLIHWDIEIRRLSAKSLLKLFDYDLDFTIQLCLDLLKNFQLNEIQTIHGTLLGLAELCNSLAGSKEKEKISKECLNELLQIVMEFYETQKQTLFQGFGSELLREGFSLLITALAKGQWSSFKPEQWLPIVESNLERKELEIQLLAADSLAALMPLVPTDQFDTLLEKYLSHLEPSKEILLRRGYLMATSRIPISILPFYKVSEMVKRFMIQTQIDKDGDQDRNDPEVRKVAVESLSLFLNQLLQTDKFMNFLNQLQIEEILQFLLVTLEDYSVDVRGDVGSWVREAGLVALKDLNILIRPTELFNQNLFERYLAKVFQLMLEKMDKVRACAGQILIQFLSNPDFQFQHKQEISKIFLSEEMNWFNLQQVFSKGILLLDFDCYRLPVLSGIIVSIGGITESLVKSSSQELIQYLKTIPKERANDVLISILTIFQGSISNERIQVPCMEVLDFLVVENLLESLLERPLDYIKQTIKQIQRLLFNNRDLKKLFCGILLGSHLVSLQSLEEDSEFRKSLLNWLINYLVHPYPKIRRFICEQLYLALMTMELGSIEEIESILMETNWDQSTSLLKPVKEQLVQLLSIQ